MLRRLLGGVAALCLVAAPLTSHAASLTPPNLTAQTSLANSDLMLVWPSATNGPLKQIQWSVLQTQMQAALGLSYLQVGNNLSDVASVTTARNNLGLGTAATGNTGTAGHSIPFLDGNVTVSGAWTWSGKLTTAASLTGTAGFNMTPGVAPTSPANGDCWLTAASVFCRAGGVTQQFLSASNNLSDVTAATARTNLGLGTAATQNTGTSGANVPILNVANTFGAKQTFLTSSTVAASLNMPQGAAPTSPVNGDCWTTATGVFCQINGSTLTLATIGGAVTSFNSRTGAITLSSADVTTALTYTPTNRAGDTFTGQVNLAAGTTTVTPLKFTAGTNLTSAAAGSVEWDGTNLFLTQTAGPTRKTVAYTDSAMSGNTTGSAAKWTTARTEMLSGDVAGSTSVDGSANWTITTAIQANAVTNADLRTSAALSLVGRSANSTGNVADISAVAASGAVLRESGSTIGFGTITGAGIASATITGGNIAGTTITGSNLVNGTVTGTQIASATVANSNLANMAATTIKANTTGGSAAPADVTIAALQGTSAATFAAGNDSRFAGPTQNSQSVNYTFVLSDAGGQIYHPSADTTARTWTIPANASVAYGVVTKIEIVNDCSAGALTLQISSDTLVWDPTGGSGTRTIAACGMATLTKVGSTRWIITGTGVS